jgi:hypothetical protein
MTFEELKDMINSTITENGSRHITGKALNLALLEIITAMEENKPEGGAASEIVYLPDMNTGEIDPADQAYNLEVYNKFKEAFEAGKPLPLLSVDAKFMFAGMEAQLGQPLNCAGYVPCTTVIFVPVDSPLAAQQGDGIMLMFCPESSGETMACIIQSDGNVMLMM